MQAFQIAQKGDNIDESRDYLGDVEIIDVLKPRGAHEIHATRKGYRLGDAGPSLKYTVRIKAA